MSNQKTFGGIPEEFGQLAKAKIVLIKKSKFDLI